MDYSCGPAVAVICWFIYEQLQMVQQLGEAQFQPPWSYIARSLAAKVKRAYSVSQLFLDILIHFSTTQ